VTTVENARTPDGRVAVTAIAVACVVAVIWAATALAGGSSGSSSSDPVGGASPIAATQDGSPGADDGRDCPDREGGGGSDPSPSSGGDALAF
jgi:hypothetical protein